SALAVSAVRIVSIHSAESMSGNFQWNPGWMAHPLTVANVLRFWAINWGVLVVLIVVAYRWTRAEERWLYRAVILSVAIVNVVQINPSDWDNHKLLDIAVLFGLLFGGRSIDRFMQKGKAQFSLASALVALLVVTGIHSYVVAFNERYAII